MKTQPQRGKFGNWLERQYIEYERELGRRITLDEFGEYVGVSGQLLGQYINGYKKPSVETFGIMLMKFGPEIFKALDIPVDDHALEMVEQIRGLSEQDALKSAAEDAARMVGGDATIVEWIRLMHGLTRAQRMQAVQFVRFLAESSERYGADDSEKTTTPEDPTERPGGTPG